MLELERTVGSVIETRAALVVVGTAYHAPTATAGIEASHASVEAIRSVGGENAIVQPIITPRFVPACTDELFEGRGALAASMAVLVQTHCSENNWVHTVVREYGLPEEPSPRDGFATG